MIPSSSTPLEELKSIYQDINEWLKFAEAKHAGLFAALIALFIAILTEESLFSCCPLIKSGILIFLIIGILFDLLSFFPFLNRCPLIRKMCYQKYKTHSGNLVFYQSIFIDTCPNGVYNSNSCSIYKAKFLSNFSQQEDNGLIDDYVKQIIQVSIVGTIKIYLFNLATKLSFFIFAILIAGIIIA